MVYGSLFSATGFLCVAEMRKTMLNVERVARVLSKMDGRCVQGAQDGRDETKVFGLLRTSVERTSFQRTCDGMTANIT